MLLHRRRRMGIIGPTYGADGSPGSSTGYQSKDSSAAVTQVHGKYFEAASRAHIFAACDQGVGITPVASFTTSAAWTLQNPVGSSKRLSILKLACNYHSGTFSYGNLYHSTSPPGVTLPSGGTTCASTCTDAGNISGAAAVGIAISGATVVTTNNKALYPFGGILIPTATTALGFQALYEDIDGAIVLEPGAHYQLLGIFAGAGTSPLFSIGMVWEEVPIVASQG